MLDEWLTAYQNNREIEKEDAQLGKLTKGSPAYENAQQLVKTHWQKWLDGIDAVSVSLGSLLVGPVVAKLQQAGLNPGARVIWLLPSALATLPLASAIDPKTKQRLGDLYETVLQPSLESLRFTRQMADRTRAPSLFAIINPTGDLEFAGLEGALVASHFPQIARDVVEGQAVYMPPFEEKSSYWHFATHGRYIFEQPTKSGLVLSSQGEGSFMSFRTLTASYDGALRPRLVTLSACETGIPALFISDSEFIGLPEAFIGKGTAGVLSTLWPVDDRATALLIAKFYDFHLGEGFEPASALWKAQSWLRQATEAAIEDYLQTAMSNGRLNDLMATKMRTSLRSGASTNRRFAPAWDLAHRRARSIPPLHPGLQPKSPRIMSGRLNIPFSGRDYILQGIERTYRRWNLLLARREIEIAQKIQA